MFTGIIRETGKVQKIGKKGTNLFFTIQAQKILKNRRIGDSLALDGVCSTIIALKKDNFTIEAMPETLRRTNFSQCQKGSRVNLEAPITLGKSLDGHLVLGHVDAVGEVSDLKKDGLSLIIMVKFPLRLAKYLAFKGSIAVNGVSLTIMDLRKDTFSVALIPHTLRETNLGGLKKGDKVNLEVDLIARYLERMFGLKEIEGKLEEKNLKIAVILPRFNEFIGLKLWEGAKRGFKKFGVPEDKIILVRVPGAFEIPLTALKLAQSRKYQVIIALGCVIKGETKHFDYVCRECADGIMKVQLQTGIPIIFEVLMVEKLEQALSRAGVKDEENKGFGAVKTALQMGSLLKTLPVGERTD